MSQPARLQQLFYFLGGLRVGRKEFITSTPISYFQFGTQQACL